MKITRVEAKILNVPVTVPVLGKTVERDVVLVEIETDTHVVGYGVTSVGLNSAVRSFINDEARPYLLGRDPAMISQIWYDLFWTFNSRSLTGVWSSAVSAIDIALWDLKGKAVGEPVWRLLGGANESVPVYGTFGLSNYTEDQLVEAALAWVANGFDKLKMVVASHSHRNRGTRMDDAGLKEDAARVRAVRTAVGDDVEVSIDANCLLPFHQALRLCELCADYDVGWFEEPLFQNDPAQLADLRKRTPIPLSAGQNEGHRYKFRDFMVHRSVDLVQPNVVNVGGFTEGARIAGLAEAFNVPIGHGGGWGYINMHLQGGVSNGTMIEIHQMDTDGMFTGVPEIVDGRIMLPQSAGLGMEPDPDAVEAYLVKG